jgi:hypothetical protein
MAYQNVLHQKYTLEEISAMEASHAPIHDIDLKKALKEDGFPIIIK